MSAADHAAVLAVWLAAVIAPGPDIMVLLRAVLRGGRRAGLAAACGTVVGITGWTVLALTGVQTLLTEAPLVLGAMQLAGGVYLCLLGAPSLWGYWQSRGRAAHTTLLPDDPDEPQPASDRPADDFRRNFTIALAANIGNPKALVFFTTVFSVVVPATASTGDRVLTGSLLITAEAIWFSGVAWCATGPRLLPLLNRHAAALGVFAGGALLALGLLAVSAGAATLWG